MPEPPQTFETERSCRLQAATLSMSERQTVENIETFGCEVVQVRRSSAGPGWSYTIGIYDTCDKPELVVVGLCEETAHFLLNEAASRLRSGVDLAAGRHRDLVDEVECEFRPVDHKWVEHLMSWATWYYGGKEFPVLQAVYPDLDNRFPEEPGFDDAFRQPLLQSDAPLSHVEKDFWASVDPGNSSFDWKFPDPPNTMVFLSEAVHSGAESVTYVSHDIEDGAWQFLGEGMSGGREPVISCLCHPIDKDPSLNELADLPLGWWAERENVAAPWIRHKDELGKNE